NYATSNKLMYYLGKSKDPNNVFATISYDATQPLASQQFNFVTIVIDENSISTYLNGKLQETNPRNGMPISRPGQDWYIGQSGAKTQFLNGAMDDIRIYNRALNPCEISTLYNTNNCGVPLNAMTKTVCKGYPATITIGGNVDATYKWSTGSTGTTQTVSPTVSTKYYITVTQPSGCKSIDSYWVYVVNCSEDASNSGELGMMNDELKGKLSLNIYPNPVMEELNIVNATNSQIRIFDMLGNEINYIEKATEHVKINMSRLSAGLYFVKIISDDGIITKRIVVYK
ncbi:MAG: LamG-like jellyroll fold domain-containing protein, partial [Bacteroidota bacterium]|nr:LamG-like jellyroll fold domain-containing protein [Bacteroidota bacterium]